VSQHLTRKELKQDNVALKVEETTHFLVAHRPLVTKIGIAVLAVLVVGLGSWFFISSRRDAREQALVGALAIENAHVGVGAPDGTLSFPNQELKDAAASKAFNSIITQNGGSEEAYAAEYYLAGADVSKSRMDDAVKKYDLVISGADSDYASLAKLGKAQVLFALGKASEGEALLKDLIAHPTSMVSKEQATMILAKAIAATQPEEARKLLAPLAGGSSEISQAAVTAMGELPQK
jgi:predicted negative regulator of RcsB-dependent stress response